ncbi:MAG: ribonuclease E/G [Pseudomonadota bacterium]
MKGRVLLLEVMLRTTPGSWPLPPTRAALVVDGRLDDLLIDAQGSNWTPGPGDICPAKITRIIPGGAFANALNGIDAEFYLRDTKALSQGQTVIVQVTGYAEAGKATPATTRLLHKGRHIIHTPGAPGVNISRQIRDPEEKTRLTDALTGLEPSGLIVRSAAIGADSEMLRQEAEMLIEHGEECARGTFQPYPICLNNRAERIAQKEWTTPPPDVVHLVGAEAYTLEDGLAAAPFDGDPFDHFGVLDEIDRLRQPRVDLPSGGWMAIEATRAMVTVDVNTGDQFGGGAAMTANIEASRELPRQLRLRGLGGQVIIDFAPLKKMHRKKIEETLKTAFRRDPIDTTLAGWTPLGNFELQRKRERRPLSELL